MAGSRIALVAVAAALVTGCTTTVVMSNAAAPVAAQLSVERFLQAANDRDVHAMGNLFGTKDGPLMDTGSTFGCAFKKIGSWFGGTACTKKSEVEIRMDAIAAILAHDDYRIVAENRVAGRNAPTTRVTVDMTVATGQQVAAVPFEVVQTSQGRWLIQTVDLERVMTAGR